MAWSSTVASCKIQTHDQCFIDMFSCNAFPVLKMQNLFRRKRIDSWMGGSFLLFISKTSKVYCKESILSGKTYFTLRVSFSFQTFKIHLKQKWFVQLEQKYVFLASSTEHFYMIRSTLIMVRVFRLSLKGF